MQPSALLNGVKISLGCWLPSSGKTYRHDTAARACLFAQVCGKLSWRSWRSSSCWRQVSAPQTTPLPLLSRTQCAACCRCGHMHLTASVSCLFSPHKAASTTTSEVTSGCVSQNTMRCHRPEWYDMRADISRACTRAGDGCRGGRRGIAHRQPGPDAPHSDRSQEPSDPGVSGAACDAHQLPLDSRTE